jgi:RNA polymerase sigma-70 factor (ECF subfamily)
MPRVGEGHDTSFALLLERHRGPVVHFLYRMVQNQAVSEELAQEVFLRVYRSRSTYEPTAKFTTWLFRIATHVALNSIRDGKKEKGHESLDVETSEGKERQVADRQPTVEQEMVHEVSSAR